ncbi:MAG TPA: WD40 repeat domain-containing protein, partial [Anaerolineae bacterium]
AAAPDGQFLAIGATDGSVALWNISGTLTTPVSIDLLELPGPVASVAIDPLGAQLLAGTCTQIDTSNKCRPSEIRRYDVKRGQFHPDQLLPSLSGHAADIRSLVFRGPEALISGDSAGKIMAWNVITPEVPIRLELLPDSVQPLWPNVRLDGKVMALSASLWDVSRPPTRTLIGQPFSDHVEISAFSPNGNTLAAARGVHTGIENDVELWDTSDVQHPQRLTAIDTNAAALAFSPDGKLLATGSSTGTLTVWNISNLRSPVQIGLPVQAYLGAVESLAFGLDSQTLASAGNDQILKLWQVADVGLVETLGTPLTSLTGLPASLAFSPNGQLMAAGDGDSQITLWDVANLRAPVQLGEAINVGLSATGIYAGRDAQRRREGNKLAFTPDSKTLLATWPVALSNGAVVDDQPKQFDVDPSSWIKRACQIVGRNFTQREWKQYFGDGAYHKTCEPWPAGE